MLKMFLCLCCVLLITTPLLTQAESTPAPSPPMGWNSWNYHGKQNINEEVVRETIDAMVESGLRDAGYEYIVVDGGWRARTLDEKGRLVPHPEKFPNGIKPLADYAHENGLKFGLHTVPGSHDCGGDEVGGMGHEDTHIDQFVEWGLDFVKVDKCILKSKWTEPLVQETYEKWNDLLTESDRNIVLSISAYEWRDWYPDTCQMSRTTYDIHCRIHRGGAMFDTPSRHSVMSIATKNNDVADLAGNGYWNDPDMIITGDHGLNFEEQKSHFALWCVMSAPLMLGNDPRNMTDEEKEIVLNADCIAIDQDPTEQGRRIKTDGDVEIWAKRMTEDRVAVLLLNRNAEESRNIAFNPSEVGIDGPYSGKDAYDKIELGVLDGQISRETPPHGCHLLILTPAIAKSQALETPPNVVLIMADDLGYGDVGCYGATRVDTPNIDRLAAEGMLFTNGYAPSATCTPTRYSILTGEYAWRQPPKKTAILDGDSPLCIEPGRFTLPQMLRDVGYRTAAIGKWHLGLGDGETRVDFNGVITPGPLEVGFDESYIIPATVDRVPSVWVDGHRVDGLDPNDPIEVSYLNNISDEPTGIERPDLLKQPADEQHACTIINGISRIGYMKGGRSARFVDEELADTVVEKSVAFIEANQDRPFFLHMGLFEPHVPRTPHPRFVGTSDCGVRGDVIHQIDWQVGQVLDALEERDLTEKTIVIVTSDNGPVLFDGYFDRSIEDRNGHDPAGDLRGWKYLVYEGGTRVPLIVKWPANIPNGQSDAIFSLGDLPATFADLTNQEIPEGEAQDSVSQLAILLGQSHGPARTSIIQHGISGGFALRDGDWKFIPANAEEGPRDMGSGANPNDTRFAAALITEDALYNLAVDPSELNNLSEEMPEKLSEMRAKFETIRNGQ